MEVKRILQEAITWKNDERTDITEMYGTVHVEESIIHLFVMMYQSGSTFPDIHQWLSSGRPVH